MWSNRQKPLQIWQVTQLVSDLKKQAQLEVECSFLHHVIVFAWEITQWSYCLVTDIQCLEENKSATNRHVTADTQLSHYQAPRWRRFLLCTCKYMQTCVHTVEDLLPVSITGSISSEVISWRVNLCGRGWGGGHGLGLVWALEKGGVELWLLKALAVVRSSSCDRLHRLDWHLRTTKPSILPSAITVQNFWSVQVVKSWSDSIVSIYHYIQFTYLHQFTLI